MESLREYDLSLVEFVLNDALKTMEYDLLKRVLQILSKERERGTYSKRGKSS